VTKTACSVRILALIEITVQAETVQ